MLCCAEAFATYIDVDRFMLVLIRIAPGPNNALPQRLTLDIRQFLQFLIRVAPGPNSTLNVATWAEDRQFLQDCAWPKQCSTQRLTLGMQSQGAKTIAHMKSTSLCQILQAFQLGLFYTALLQGVVLVACPANFFKLYSQLGFFRIQAWIFRCSRTRPPLRGKVC